MKAADKRACSEASKRFRVDAQFDDVKVRGVCQKVEGEQRLHRDAEIYMTANPFQSISQTNAVLKVLAEERLEQFADQVQTRILEGKPAGVNSSHAGNQ